MTAPVTTRLRLDAIDFVRGVVMILMVLDHTRDFVHAGAVSSNALDPRTTTVLLYLTRWVTHLCAPTFVLLAGLGVGLRRIRGATAGEVAWFLFTRGLWLVVAELTVFRLVIWWNVDLSFLAFLQVIWAIGWSMIALSLLVRLPLGAVGAIAAIIIFGHNLLDRVPVGFWFPGAPNPPGPLSILWILLHQSSFFTAGPGGPIVFARYPVLPWIGVIAAGYVMAAIYDWPADRRRRALAGAALAMTALFVVLRTWNIYGNPGHWAPQPTLVQSAMAFMDVEKYPPSLQFLLITLVPALLTLAALDGRTIAGGLGGAIVTFGRVPFFFYFLQWNTAHVSGMIVTAALGKSVAPYFMHLIDYFSIQPTPDFGGPLWAVYVAWILSLIVIYPLCRWFAGVKARRRDWYLSYL